MRGAGRATFASTPRSTSSSPVRRHRARRRREPSQRHRRRARPTPSSPSRSGRRHGDVPATPHGRSTPTRPSESAPDATIPTGTRKRQRPTSSLLTQLAARCDVRRPGSAAPVRRVRASVLQLGGDDLRPPTRRRRRTHDQRNGQLELLHAQDVAARILELLAEPADRRRVIVRTDDGQPISVSEAWELLQRLHHRYVDEATIPATPTLSNCTCSTLRSQLYTNGFYPRPITLHADPRARSPNCAGPTVSARPRSRPRFRASPVATTSTSTRSNGSSWSAARHRSGSAGSSPTMLTSSTSRRRPDRHRHAAAVHPQHHQHRRRQIMTTVFWAADHFDPANPDTYVEPVEPAAA